jgi:hypothetical protein
LDLGEATTFPLIIFFMPSHGAYTQMSFCPKTPKLGVFKFPKLGLLVILKALNFLCKLSIEMRVKEKL